MKMPSHKQLTLEQPSAICTSNKEAYSDRTIADRLEIQPKSIHNALPS